MKNLSPSGYNKISSMCRIAWSLGKSSKLGGYRLGLELQMTKVHKEFGYATKERLADHKVKSQRSWSLQQNRLVEQVI